MQHDPFTKKDIEKKAKVKRGSRDHKRFLRGILKDLEGIREVLK